jgi:putative ABC transport system ATP-binding protein
MSRLTLENVTKVYGEGDQAVTALSDASLSVEAGELVAIVGPSGSGKTTLLAVAGALLQPTRGTVAIDSEPVARMSAGQMADLRLGKIGFILQSSNLVPYLRARDQLQVVSYLAGRNDAQAKARAEELLDELGMHQRGDHYPEALSGGERQRVAIARALMNDPAVILADEPTANLDSRRGHQIVEMLRRLVKEGGKAGVMVTHDERMLDLCDRVCRIEDGVLRVDQPAATVA